MINFQVGAGLVSARTGESKTVFGHPQGAPLQNHWQLMIGYSIMVFTKMSLAHCIYSCCSFSRIGWTC